MDKMSFKILTRRQEAKMAEVTVASWEGLQFAPILEHLNALFPEQEKVIIDPNIDLKFKEWLEALTNHVVQRCWPQFFKKWYQTLLIAIARDDVRRLASSSMSIYLKAGKCDKWPGIKVAEHGVINVFLSRAKFVVIAGKDDKHYPILPKQESDSVLRFAQGLMALHPVLGMRLDPQELADYILTNNSSHGLLADCWPDIVANFVSAVIDTKIYEIPAIAEVEALRTETGKKPTPFLLATAGNFKIYIRSGVLVVVNEKKIEGPTFEPTNPEAVQELSDLLSNYAELLFSVLPITVSQVKQALHSLNPLPEETSAVAGESN
ncbi:MAG: hypothetical protein ACOZBH_01625 [Patescibacteria group bacterium]